MLNLSQKGLRIDKHATVDALALAHRQVFRRSADIPSDNPALAQHRAPTRRASGQDALTGFIHCDDDISLCDPNG